MDQQPRPRWRLIFGGLSLAIIAAVLATRPQWISSDIELVEARFWWANSALVLAAALSGAAGLTMLCAALLMPQRPQFGRWIQVLRLYRSHYSLRAEHPNAASLPHLFGSMSDEAVRAASILPSHSTAGRGAAAAELARRDAQITSALTPVVPGFFGAQQLPRAAEIVFGAGARARAIVGGISTLSFAVAVSLMVWNYFAAQDLQARAVSAGVPASIFQGFDGNPTITEIPPELAGYRQAHAIVLRTNAALIAVGFFMFAWILVRFANWFRAHPVRVLLLRKFNDGRLGAFYNRLVRQELQPLGHVVALSDKHVRRTMSSWWANQFYMATSSFAGAIWVALTFPIALFLRLFDRTRWGPAFVTTPRDFRLLARRLYDRMELNVETSMGARAYLIRTSDAWWKLVIDLLLLSADVIVLDLSNVTQGTVWEIETIGRLNLWDRVVCIAHGDSAAAAADIVGTLSSNGSSRSPAFFCYDASGSMADRPGFRAHMIKALRASVEAKVARLPLPTQNKSGQPKSADQDS